MFNLLKNIEKDKFQQLFQKSCLDVKVQGFLAQFHYLVYIISAAIFKPCDSQTVDLVQHEFQLHPLKKKKKITCTVDWSSSSCKLYSRCCCDTRTPSMRWILALIDAMESMGVTTISKVDPVSVSMNIVSSSWSTAKFSLNPWWDIIFLLFVNRS